MGAESGVWKVKSGVWRVESGAEVTRLPPLQGGVYKNCKLIFDN